VAGFKDFVDGVPLFASELDGYLMRQTVMRFATTTALINALPAGIREVGMLAWADSTGILYMWDGTNWIPWFSPEKTFSPIFTAGGSNITVGNSIVNSWWRYSGGLVLRAVDADLRAHRARSPLHRPNDVLGHVSVDDVSPSLRHGRYDNIVCDGRLQRDTDGRGGPGRLGE